jgi:integrase
MAIELTDKVVKDIPAPAAGNRVTYDAAVRGLGARVTAAGRHTFVFRYRVRSTGTERTHTIGDAGHWAGGEWKADAWTVAKARKEAAALRQRVDQGGDPMGDLHAARAEPTVADLAARFRAEHMLNLRPGTQDAYERLLRVHILPALGSRRVVDLRHADVDGMHRKIRGTGPYAANRAAAVLSKMLSCAIRWEIRSDNPAQGIERAQEIKRERFLTGTEIAKLSEALAAHPEQPSANAVRLLLLTGARRTEVLSATWGQFDLAGGVWLKPAAATKQKKDHRLPLSAPALQLLVQMKAEADQENARRQRDGLKPLDHLFPGKDAKPLKDIKHFWAAVCRRADLSGIRLHDLRHTHASILASLGLSLPIIGALLGHTQASTTQRYAHLLDDPLRAATERVGAIVMGAGKAGGDVVPLGRRRGGQ